MNVPDQVDKGTGSISGQLLMLDGNTPHVACVVQAVTPGDAPSVVRTALSDEQGRYQLTELPSGLYQVRCYTGDEYVYYQDGGIIQLASQTIGDIDFHLPPFKRGAWKSFTYLDGLNNDWVKTIQHSPDGLMWLSTGFVSTAIDTVVVRYDGQQFENLQIERLATVNNIHQDDQGLLWFIGDGVACYDGEQLTTVLGRDQLTDREVWSSYRCPDGTIWLGTSQGGPEAERNCLVRCQPTAQGIQTRNFTTRDGLPHDWVTAIHRDPDGTLWFGTGDGIARYDGQHFVNFRDKLRPQKEFRAITTIHRDVRGCLWFGTYEEGVLCYDGNEFTSLTTEEGLLSNTVGAIASDSDGILWFGTGWFEVPGRGVSQYDGQSFINYTTADGLVDNEVLCIYRDPDGVRWFGTANGLSRYDERGILQLTTRDGLVDNHIKTMVRESKDTMWLGTHGGVSQCHLDSGQINFTNLTQADGLVGHEVSAIHCVPDGDVWFGTRWNGVSRYQRNSGKQGELGHFENYTMADGLVHNYVTAIHQADDGRLWFGVIGAGISVYDGHQFTNYTIADGLPHVYVFCFHRDVRGELWVGTAGGVCRYDGRGFRTLSVEDGLIGHIVYRIESDLDGMLWFITPMGVSRYDGMELTNFSREDERVYAVLSQGGTGDIDWFATQEGSLVGYDGVSRTDLDSRDGLGGKVTCLDVDEEGAVWLGTDRGVTVYRRQHQCPRVRIVSIQTDVTYWDVSSVPAIIEGERVTISYQAVDYVTTPSKRQYRVALDGIWGRPTRSDVLDVMFKEVGCHTVSVQCIDRDLNYSKPVELSLKVVADPRDAQIEELESKLERRNRELEAELADARDMQMRLLPEHVPFVEGAEIAGRCMTANTVGGDFFSYLPGNGTHQIGLLVADVSGKAMRGAMNAVMTDGVVHTALAEHSDVSPASLLNILNDVLTFRMESDMNVTMAIGLLDTQPMTLTLANAAHHAYPLLVRGGEVTPLKARGLPLGMKTGVQYREETYGLQPGDVLVLMTDGIIESHDSDGGMYGDSDRLEGALTRFTAQMTAEDMVDALIQDAIDYSGGERDDDMTVVVAKLKE